MSSLKENFIKYLFYKIEKSAKPDFKDLSIDDYNVIISVYQYVTNTPLSEVSDQGCFSAKMKEISGDIDASTIVDLYEIVASNVDKITFIHQLNPVDMDELLAYNINLESGIAHENFQNYSEHKLILQLISSQSNEIYELDSRNLERVVLTLKEIYNKL